MHVLSSLASKDHIEKIDHAKYSDRQVALLVLGGLGIYLLLTTYTAY